jgi:hypothetical protein
MEPEPYPRENDPSSYWGRDEDKSSQKQTSQYDHAAAEVLLQNSGLSLGKTVAIADLSEGVCFTQSREVKTERYAEGVRCESAEARNSRT